MRLPNEIIDKILILLGYNGINISKKLRRDFVYKKLIKYKIMSPEELASHLHKLTIFSIPYEYLMESNNYKNRLISELVSKSEQLYGNRYDIYIKGLNIYNDKFKKLYQDILSLCKSLNLTVETRDKHIKLNFPNFHTALLMNFDTSLNYTSHIDTVFEINDINNILQYVFT